MKNKVFLVGSTQTKHIAKLLESNHIPCVDMNKPEVRKWNGFVRNIYAIFMMMQCGIVYCVGGSCRRNRATLLAKLLHKKVVMHWIGTDVLIAAKEVNQGRTYKKNDIELAGSELLVEELGQIGIVAGRVPIVPFGFKFSLKEMPQKHSVLVYLPKGREEFYGGRIVKELAKREPEVCFHIVANDGFKDLEGDNVKYHGFLSAKEMERLYEEITILIRYPKHDGMSLMVLEALGMGKNVLYKYKHPCVETPRSENINDIYKVFKEMIDRPVRMNVQGHDYVRNFYSSEHIMELYRENQIFIKMDKGA